MKKHKEYWYEELNPVVKLIICLIAGLVGSILSGPANGITRVMVGWDVFSFCLLASTWFTFSVTKSSKIRSQARQQDPKWLIVFILVMVAVFASITAVILMIVSKDDHHINSESQIPVALFGMVLSWLLIHTLFTLRYAHIYYGDDIDNPTNHAGGLDFPGDKRPEYHDFAYFSFVLGMTFQVSDVSITSKAIRRLVLFHSLLSFAYNTIMIALVINVTV